MYELNWLLYFLIKKMYFYRYSNYHLIKKNQFDFLSKT